MRPLLIICTFLVAGCSFFKKRGQQDPYPLVPFELVQDRAGGLQANDHLSLARWDDKFYYFEWREIVEPATQKTKEGAGRVRVDEFDAKNGRSLERKVGIIGKEDLNGQLYNAGQPT